MKSINVAIIGGGRVAMHHCRMLTEVPEVNLRAICDLREDRGRPLAKEYKVKAYI